MSSLPIETSNETILSLIEPVEQSSIGNMYTSNNEHQQDSSSSSSSSSASSDLVQKAQSNEQAQLESDLNLDVSRIIQREQTRSKNHRKSVLVNSGADNQLVVVNSNEGKFDYDLISSSSNNQTSAQQVKSLSQQPDQSMSSDEQRSSLQLIQNKQQLQEPDSSFEEIARQVSPTLIEPQLAPSVMINGDNLDYNPSSPSNQISDIVQVSSTLTSTSSSSSTQPQPQTQASTSTSTSTLTSTSTPIPITIQSQTTKHSGGRVPIYRNLLRGFKSGEHRIIRRFPIGSQSNGAGSSSGQQLRHVVARRRRERLVAGGQAHGSQQGGVKLASLANSDIGNIGNNESNEDIMQNNARLHQTNGGVASYLQLLNNRYNQLRLVRANRD